MSIFITKFKEMVWNDGVFESTEEQLDGLGSALVFIYYCEFWFFLYAKIFSFSLCFKGEKLAKFIRFQAGWKLMWWCGDVMMWWCDYVMLDVEFLADSRKFLPLIFADFCEEWLLMMDDGLWVLDFG